MKTKKAIARLAVVAIWLVASSSQAANRTIGVFVALADNASQGIVPVPAAIGNGDDPERNLYWGTAEGLKGVFDKSKEWRLAEKNDNPAEADILRARTVLLTTQLMYPGAFILHATAEGWLNGATLAGLRQRAGEAYAANQKLSKKAGLGVFAKMAETAAANKAPKDTARKLDDPQH